MDGVKDVNVYNKIFEAVEEVPGASKPAPCKVKNDRESLYDYPRYRG